MKRTRKNLTAILMAAAIGCVIGGAVTLTNVDQTSANASAAIEMDFSKNVNSSWVAPASFYGWKTAGNRFIPDLSFVSTPQVGYLGEAIALNEAKYISLDFYAAGDMDIGLIDSSVAFNAWNKTSVFFHLREANGHIRLDQYIDANDLWLADYAAVGNCVADSLHKLEIISDGTNLTFKVDGVAAFTDKAIAVPVSQAYLTLRTGAGSYIDNLYIANGAPVTESTVKEFSFTNAAMDSANFSAMALDGWGVKNGVYSPKNEGAVKFGEDGNLSSISGSATKYNEAISTTGTKYISMDFYAQSGVLDIGLLDAAAENIWGNGLFVHVPNYQNILAVTSNVDTGAWLGGANVNYTDGVAHTLEIFINNGKVSYKIDGAAPTLDTQATEFDAPAENVYLVLRATSADSYIDNLYIADSAPTTTDVEIGFEGYTGFFKGFSGNYAAQNGVYAPNAAWNSVQSVEKLDLTTVEEISLEFCLTLNETYLVNNDQFHVGLFAEPDPSIAPNEWTCAGKSLAFKYAPYEEGGVTKAGGEVWWSSQFGGLVWINSISGNYYDETLHALSIKFADGNMTVWLDGKETALTTEIPANEVYLMLSATNTASYVDNLTIKYKEAEATGYTVTVKDVAGETVDAVENVEGEYTLPERTDLLAYDVNGTLYPAGATIQVTENISIVAVTATFETDAGASVRMVEANPGLRFSSKISFAAYNYLKDKNAVVMGTLVAKADDVTDYSDLTTDFDGTHLNIVNTKEHEPKVEDTANYNFNAAIVNIKPANYTAQFVARAYITVTYGEGFETFYTNGNGESRSVAYVANEAYNDRSASYDETKFKYEVEGSTEDKKYSPYTETQLGILAAFAGIETASTAFVAVDGDDDNNGVVATKAVATIARALEIVEGQENATVYLLDGEYEVAETISLPSNVALKSLNAGGAVLSGATVATEIVEKTDSELGRVWEIPCKKKPLNCM